MNFLVNRIHPSRPPPLTYTYFPQPVRYTMKDEQLGAFNPAGTDYTPSGSGLHMKNMEI